MKNILNNWGFLLILGLGIFVSSCGDDDTPAPPTTSEGINVSDGLYMQLGDQDPTFSDVLTAETVDAADFGSQDRAGFVGGYVFLNSGMHQLVQITNKEITNTIGGTVETAMDEASGCDFNSYMVVSTSDNGASFNVANAGLYRITYDQMTNEMILYQISTVGVIGSATANGWGGDTDLPIDGSISADGAVWKGEGIVLRQGEYKFRFNCRWSIDRREDPSAGFDPANGYQLFTNFGGAPNNLLPGNDGSNIPISVEEVGTYTITMTWDPDSGFSAEAERTGDAPELTFDPNEYQFGVIGDASANGWDADRNMYYAGENEGTHKWIGVVTLADAGAFKLRTNDDWGFNLGGSLASDGSSSQLVADGDNIATPGAGAYYLVLTTADEGTTWDATMTANGWGVIGEGSPVGNWDSDMDMTADGFADGVTTYSISGAFTTAGWKFRAGDDWGFNLGGDMSALAPNGDNFALGADGNYTVTLSFDGESYTATAEAQ